MIYFRIKSKTAASVVEYAILLMVMASLVIPLGFKMIGVNQAAFNQNSIRVADVFPSTPKIVASPQERNEQSCSPDHYTFYDFDFRLVYGSIVGTSFVYEQEAFPSGKAIITDLANGKPGQFFTDDDGGEIARGDFFLNSTRAFNLSADAERVWTLRDKVNGEEFQVVELDIGNVIFPGYYTLSESALVREREYEIIHYSATPNDLNDSSAFKYTDFKGHCPRFS